MLIFSCCGLIYNVYDQAPRNNLNEKSFSSLFELSLDVCVNAGLVPSVILTQELIKDKSLFEHTKHTG